MQRTHADNPMNYTKMKLVEQLIPATNCGSGFVYSRVIACAADIVIDASGAKRAFGDLPETVVGSVAFETHADTDLTGGAAPPRGTGVPPYLPIGHLVSIILRPCGLRFGIAGRLASR
jgi:hypothetical protein